MEITEYLELVEQGHKPKIDFINKVFKLNGKEITVYAPTVTDAYSEIEELYANFKRSYPSEQSVNHKHDYFKALKAEEMTDSELVNGEDRRLARARLETSFLCWVLNGSLTWDDDTKWFWQSKSDKDLIILKEWIKK